MATVAKENFFTKLKDFFKRLFLKNSENDIKLLENKNLQKETFEESIKVKEDNELKRLENLQLMIRNGQIQEDEVSLEDSIKLRKLYQDQINNLKEKIENHRQAIIKIRYKLNAMN